MQRRRQRMAERRAGGCRAPLVALLSAVGVLLGAVPVAMASPTSVMVTAGSLTVTAPAVNDAAVILLDGTAQTAAARLEAFSVTDARGSGTGWALSLQATPFREWDGTAYVADGHGLPAGSLTLDGLSVTADGTESDHPEVVAGPYTVDDRSVRVATATAGAGMGRFIFTPTDTLRVAIPANTYARTYRSELSISVTSGP